jgi:hypothetical protein
MYIVATFIGDDTFTHLIDTNKLPEKLKNEIESKVLDNPNSTFDGDNHFCDIQEGVIPENSVYPLIIHGLITVHLYC